MYEVPEQGVKEGGPWVALFVTIRIRFSLA